MSTKARRASYEENIKPYLDKITEWAKEGCTKKQIYDNLHVSKNLFYKALSEHKELEDAFKRAQEIPNEKVENALFKRACGYQWTEVKVKQVLDRDGNIVELTETRTVDVAPDPTSIIFWLTNMMRDKWKKMPDAAEIAEQAVKAIAVIPKRELLEQPKGDKNED